MARRDKILTDLDLILRAQVEEGEEADASGNKASHFLRGPITVKPNDWPELKINGTKVTLVSVLIDDSGSIDARGIESKLTEGAEDMIEEIKAIASNQKRDIFLNLTGFRCTYFCGNVLDSNPKEILSQIDFIHRTTPLVITAVNLAKTTEHAETALNDMGISVTVSMLLITDGNTEGDRLYPSEFKDRCILRHPHWKFSGMGITRDCEYRAEKDRKDFTRLFQEMGLKKIVTPSSNGIGEALSSFSKSVSMV